LPGNWIGRKPENGGNQVEPFVELSPCQTATDVHAVSYTSSSFGGYHEGVGTVRASGGDLGGGSETLAVTPKSGSHWDGDFPHPTLTQSAKGSGGIGASNQEVFGGRGAGLVAKCLTTRTGSAYNPTDETLPIVKHPSAVRRLTPRECERLQGFKDDYTQISWRGKEPEDCPNGHRYKAMGNSMAVPVMRWIGERIKKIEEGE
jgi:DNA (cytosine-5)-methyltransferase 1